MPRKGAGFETTSILYQKHSTRFSGDRDILILKSHQLHVDNITATPINFLSRLSCVRVDVPPGLCNQIVLS